MPHLICHQYAAIMNTNGLRLISTSIVFIRLIPTIASGWAFLLTNSSYKLINNMIISK